MVRRIAMSLIVLGVFAFTSARADIVITLEAKDAGGAAITGEVPAGTLVDVDVFLSTAPGDGLLSDVRLVQFDFGATDVAIELGTFTWLLNPGVDDSMYFATDALPVPSAAYIGLSRVDGFILDIDETPVLVARIAMTVFGSGVLDLGASDAAGQAAIRTDFADPINFTWADGNLGGGSLAFAIPPSGPDDDGDGVPNSGDALPDNPDEITDTDSDGVGNNADPDDDGDGTNDDEDDFPLDDTETVDTDSDGVGNNADPDDDGDGTNDDEDDFPLDPAEVVDSDEDGVGNNADTDDDDDGTVDGADAFPLDPAEVSDSDGDGVGDNADEFPSDASETVDTDGDGVGDGADAFPTDPDEAADSDGDGVGDNADAFPNDPDRSTETQTTGGSTSRGFCGAGCLPGLLLVFVGLGGYRCRREFRPRPR